MKTSITIAPLLLLLLVALGLPSCAQKPQTRNAMATLMFYNVENLYDTIDDPLTDDGDFLPTGELQWNSPKYKLKLKNLSHVIADAGGLPDIVGLCEIENETVLTDLVKEEGLKPANYGVVTYNSPDERGIQTALLYKTTSFTVQHKEPIKVTFPFEDDKTRDILYVAGKLANKQTLHLFVNHAPSRREGQDITERRRVYVASLIRAKVDSIIKAEPNANIIVMGDMNDGPTDKSLAETLGANAVWEKTSPAGLYNLMTALKAKGKGTHKFKGEWECLDHFIVSGNLLSPTMAANAEILENAYLLDDDPKGGKRLARTYAGDKYLGGYSDHLPILLRIGEKK